MAIPWPNMDLQDWYYNFHYASSTVEDIADDFDAWYDGVFDHYMGSIIVAPYIRWMYANFTSLGSDLESLYYLSQGTIDFVQGLNDGSVWYELAEAYSIGGGAGDPVNAETVNPVLLDLFRRS